MQTEVAKSILRARKELGETFIIVSHDMDFVAQVCDRVALMHLGKIVEIGDTAAVLSRIGKKEVSVEAAAAVEAG